VNVLKITKTGQMADRLLAFDRATAADSTAKKAELKTVLLRDAGLARERSLNNTLTRRFGRTLSKLTTTQMREQIGAYLDRLEAERDAWRDAPRGEVVLVGSLPRGTRFVWAEHKEQGDERVRVIVQAGRGSPDLPVGTWRTGPGVSVEARDDEDPSRILFRGIQMAGYSEMARVCEEQN